MAKGTQNASGAPYFWVPCSHKCHCSLGLHGIKVRTMHFADFGPQNSHGNHKLPTITICLGLFAMLH